MTINNKLEKLQEVKVHLKKKFVGIDDIIDSIIDKITNWYLVPNIQLRPLIINLWGLTGVGKTDLIREIVKQLDILDNFTELTFSPEGITSNIDRHNFSCTDSSSFNNFILNSNVKPNVPGILFLDEFQNLQTIDSYGENIVKSNSKTNLNDIWTFLSDGLVQPSVDAASDLEWIVLDLIEAANRKKESKKEKKKGDINFYSYEARDFKTQLGLDLPLQDIMKMTEEDLINLAQTRKADKTIFKPKNYQQLLVFVSGNLDDAYKHIGNLSDADQDADNVYQKTKDINILDVKHALSKKFKPEQIARLGNIHIIYPSLSKAAYKELIEKRIDSIINQIKQKQNLVPEIVIDKSLHKLIYNNGIFPTQGVRPLFTTIDDIFNLCLPSIFTFDDIKNVDKVSIYYKKKIIINFIDKNENIVNTVMHTFEGSLDKIRNKLDNNKDYKAAISVHEAGHALLYCLLYHIAPPLISLTPASLTSEGETHVHQHDYSISNVIKDVQICYGGKLAEEIILGESCFGGYADYQEATNLVCSLVRHEGFNGHALLDIPPDITRNFPTYKSSNDNPNIEIDTSVDDSNELIQYISKHLQQRAQDLLLTNKHILLAFSRELFRQKFMDSVQIKKFLSKYDIFVKIKNSNHMITSNFYERLFTDD